MIFFFENLVDSQAAALSASSADTEFPVANLQNYLLSKVWRTTGSTASEYLLFDFNTATGKLSGTKVVNALVIAGHNFDGTETIVLKAKDTNSAWGSPSFSQAVTLKTRFPLSVPKSPPYAEGTVLDFAVTFASQTYRYWRLEITKSSAADIRQIGRVYLGLSYDAGYQADPEFGDMSRSFQELANIEKSIGGQVYAERRALYDINNFSVSPIPESVMQYLRYYLRDVGLSLPFFFKLSTTDPLDTPYYVRQRSSIDERCINYGTEFLWSVGYSFEQQL